MKISNPVNDTQREFNRLCDLGGGPRGGPAPVRVRELIRDRGKQLNVFATEESQRHLAEFSDCNPWHVCYAVGLAWGHLAKLDLDFTEHAVRLMTDWNDEDLSLAKTYHWERGPQPIEDSLRGGNVMFEWVKLPQSLPSDLARYRNAQNRWFSPLISKNRPRYVGSWNATAMFMVALFSNPGLGAQLLSPEVVLPPGGPIHIALRILHRANVLPREPSGTDLDDEAFEPGALYDNNDLMTYLLKGVDDCSLLDTHSGLYLLGTRLKETDNWF